MTADDAVTRDRQGSGHRHAAVRLLRAGAGGATFALAHPGAGGRRVVARGDGGAGGQCDGEGVALGAVRVAGGGAR